MWVTQYVVMGVVAQLSPCVAYAVLMATVCLRRGLTAATRGVVGSCGVDGDGCDDVGLVMMVAAAMLSVTLVIVTQLCPLWQSSDHTNFQRPPSGNKLHSFPNGNSS